MMEIIEKAGEYIAEVTGAEAGLVTSGSFVSMVLGTTASILRGSELSRYEIKPYERLNFDSARATIPGRKHIEKGCVNSEEARASGADGPPRLNFSRIDNCYVYGSIS